MKQQKLKIVIVGETDFEKLEDAYYTELIKRIFELRRSKTAQIKKDN